MEQRYRVALALDLAMPAAGREFCVGAQKLAHQRLDWEVQRIGRTSMLTWEQALLSRPDGIIGLLEPWYQVTAEQVGDAQVVIVNAAVKSHPFHTVTSDDVESGRRAARYLLERRLEHFAYVESSAVYFSQQRRVGFEQVLREAGFTAPLPSAPTSLLKDQPERFRQWLRSMGQPCGILAANDSTGLDVVNEAHAAGLSVPDEIAVIGISNDELSCIESVVTLTSVPEDYVQIGYRAAEHLDRLMRGEQVPGRKVLIPPGEVIERESTRVFGVSDQLVQRALLLIHQEGKAPTTVEQLLETMGNVSRRLLEMRFRKALGRSPYQEMLHRRIALSQRQLRRTRLPIGEIAYAAGFYDTAQFCRHFKNITGQTPSQYRSDSDESARIEA